MLRIKYRQSDWMAQVSWDEVDEGRAWLRSIRRGLIDRLGDAVGDGQRSLTMPWALFIGARVVFADIVQAYRLRRGTDYDIDGEAAILLRNAVVNHAAFEGDGIVMPEAANIQAALAGRGFERELTTEQVRNVSQLLTRAAGATFSVPGAGKTTEALAFFTMRAESGEPLLVVAPKNAFGAWEEQLAECVPTFGESFVRLTGGWAKIREVLQSRPRLMLITYHQLVRVTDLVGLALYSRPTFMFLDESHRFKGSMSRAAQAVQSLSHLPCGKLILSGTPMPQSDEDLLPQFKFLFPEVPVGVGNVVDAMRRVYVRTTKAELGLPPVTRRIVTVSMGRAQQRLYDLMKWEVVRQAEAALTDMSRANLRRLGRSVMRILQLVSNPGLLAGELGFLHRELLEEVIGEGAGPKITFVLERVRQLISQGHKVLVWTSFVANVEFLAAQLAELGVVFIHGGVNAGSDEEDETREGRIRRFHEDPAVRVLVANPAAASEGISLHRVCHHAIYLDRTFNAAHYLQSEDRIHRLGLAPEQETIVEIMECDNSIDSVVRSRLAMKIQRMAAALEDHSIYADPIPYDPELGSDSAEDTAGAMNRDDVAALAEALRGGA